jgi:hypothetical protein
MTLSRRDERTEPGVLTLGNPKKKFPPRRGGGRFLSRDRSINETADEYLTPLQHPQPATWVQFRLGAVLQHSTTPSLRVAGFEDEDDDENDEPVGLCWNVLQIFCNQRATGTPS